ncbi:LrgB family protein [Paenibacillus sp. IB182496]|uniref:LrgB family protein n=1 Tax=Paenibacillus sabuli TaxID=2772509 RepID=A0A927GTD5_9BACL|nr:LrgB family protein [Paenibacillus sabuli]MBD2847231.1 LrgB family protein [Paenibacillus sabuli]
MDNGEWLQRPEWGVALTVAAYAAALLLRRRLPWMHPLFVGTGLVVLILLAGGVSYEDYRIGGDLVLFMLGPATVALGVPLYKHSRQLRHQLGAVLAGVTAGSLASIGSAWLLAAGAGLSSAVASSLLPKSVTSAVSVSLAGTLGGIPELTAVLTVLTGLLGSMFGPLLLRRCRLGSDLAIGVGVGTAAHGIGTARLVNDSQWQGSVGALAMSISCIVTPLLLLPLHWLLP